MVMRKVLSAGAPTITLGIVRNGETAVRHIQLIWDYSPELINPRGPQNTATPLERQFGPEPGSPTVAGLKST